LIPECFKLYGRIQIRAFVFAYWIALKYYTVWYISMFIAANDEKVVGVGNYCVKLERASNRKV